MRLLPSVCLAALLAATAVTAAPSSPRFGTFGFDSAGMDRSVDPGDDFYRYANGAWERNTVIPADQSQWGLGLPDQTLGDVRKVVEAAAANPRATGSARQVGDMYASFMDEGGIEARGLAPLGPDLARIAAIRTQGDLAAAFGWINRSAGFGQTGRMAVMAPFKVSVATDLKQSDTYMALLDQGELGLPDRDYYLLADNKNFARIRAAYQAHVARMLTLASFADAAAKATDVVALERRIAAAQWSRAQRRDLSKAYNPTPMADLATRYPGFDWGRFLAATGPVAKATRINVGEPEAIRALAAMVAEVPLDQWRAYLAYSLLNARAPVLPKAFVDEDFTFQAAVTGATALPDRWKRGVAFVSPNTPGTVGGLSDAVGRLYVARYFPPETKAQVDVLVRNLLAAMRARIEHVDWMAPETKVRALAKIGAFHASIGYPDHWVAYAAVRIARGDAYGNLERTTQATFDRMIRRLGGPVDHTGWDAMTPQTVNAMTDPTQIRIVFPAAFLQPPYFDPHADPAVNYGAIGVVIGHEISHNFDDQGAKFDEHGRMATWWTTQDTARFKALTERLVAQYAAYEPLPGVHVNGRNTLGENMADLAGLNVAHDAWLTSLGGKPAPVLDGMTGEQRFFLGFAQAWRAKYRDAAMLRQLTSNEHTPSNYRPYAVRNLDSWYDAFQVKPGTRLYLAPEDRIKIW